MARSNQQLIFRAACDAIGGALTSDGFRYRKSARTTARARDPWVESVTFGTSRNNILPGYVALDVRASLECAALGAWRREHGIDLPWNEELLFATEVENVTRPAPPYIRYNVHDPAERSRVVERVVHVMRSEVLPLFDLVRDPAALCAAIEAGSFPCLRATEVDLFLWSGHEALARRYLRALASREDVERIQEVAKIRGLT
jgi:hypothetical protein